MADPNKELLDINDAVLYAMMSYLLVLVAVPLLVKKDDPFVNFHAKQGLVLLIGIIGALIAAPWLPVVGNALFVILLVADMAGLVQALLGRRWKIPLIGNIAGRFSI